MGGRMDKLPMANDDVTEWENRLEEAQDNFVKVAILLTSLQKKYRPTCSPNY
jgi:hypothetical protein